MNNGSEANLWLMGLRSADYCSGSLTNFSANNAWLMLPLFLAALIIALPYIDRQLADKTQSKLGIVKFIAGSAAFLATIIISALTAYYLLSIAIEIARLLSDRCSAFQNDWQILIGVALSLIIIGVKIYLKLSHTTPPTTTQAKNKTSVKQNSKKRRKL